MNKKRPKKTDSYDQQKQAYWRTHDVALPLRERFPSLASLSISMDFENPGWGNNPSPMRQHVGPEDKAFFQVQCPHRECVGGGFNLLDAVSKLVNDGLKEATEAITCQGWQDHERISRHRCLLKMNYKITAAARDGSR